MQGKTEGKRRKGRQRMKWLASITDSQTEETGNMTSEAFVQALMCSNDLVGRLEAVHLEYLCLEFSLFSNPPLLYFYAYYAYYAFPSQVPSKTERVLVELRSAHKETPKRCAFKFFMF